MSINNKELSLLISEIPLIDSLIQDIREHDFRSLTFYFFNREAKAWQWFVEIGTPYSRCTRTNINRPRSLKTQRFNQYLRSHIKGSRIINVEQIKNDRFLILTLKRGEEILKLCFAFYSGPGANIYVLDENNKILELLMRRPKRGDAVGNTFVFPPEKEEGKFSVREWSGESFNKFLDINFSNEKKDIKIESLIENCIIKRDRTLKKLTDKIDSIEKQLDVNKQFEDIKKIADLLSTNSYQIKPKMESIELLDFENNKFIISLDPKLKPFENIESYYQKYQKAKLLLTMLENDLERANKELLDKEEYYENLLSISDSTALLLALEKELKAPSDIKSNEVTGVGLRKQSGKFTLLIGRNANENDEILRKHTRGSDTWVHTRDYPGGYVIIKAIKDKTIPLQTLLDAAQIAAHYSKGKGEKNIDLYYTEVKYLRRVKDGKKGLVIPTHERNLNINYDENKVKEILSGEN